MKLTDAEKIDRLTIEILKETNGNNCSDLVSSLYFVNYKMWWKEEEISKAKDLEKIGKLYLELRVLTKKRARIKNESKTY